MTGFQDNAGAFATTPEQRVRELRREAVTIAIDFIAGGYAHVAGDVMAECLAEQMKVSGIRPLEVVGGNA